MNLKLSLSIMFIASFVIQYYLMSIIMLNNSTFFTNNLGKVYLSVIMGLFMVLLEVIMHDHRYGVFSVNYYIIFIILLGLFVYLYKKQVAINDKQYIDGMIEHHSMALLTSEEILKKTDNYHVAKLAKNIISQQSDELQVMKELSNKLSQ